MRTEKQIKAACMGGGIYLAAVFGMNFSFDLSVGYDVPTTTLGNAVWAFRQMLDGYGVETALAAIGLALLLYYSVRHVCWPNRKHMVMLVCMSGLAALLNVAGFFMYHRKTLSMLDSAYWLLFWLALSAGWGIVFFFAGAWAHTFFRSRKGWSETTDITDDRKLFLLCFFGILLCWAPYIISFYPSSMDNDVFNQLAQFFSLESYTRSNNHPWFSTCVLGLFVQLGQNILDSGFGVFLYVLVRDIFMAYVFAAVCREWKRAGAPRGIALACFCFYAIMPVWGAYAKHAFKDTYGIALFTWFMLSCYQWTIRPREERKNWLAVARVAVSGLLAMLFRHNFIFVIAPMLLAMALSLCRPSAIRAAADRASGAHRAAVIGVLLAPILLYALYSYIYLPAAGVQTASTGEAFSLPLQMMARTVQEHSEELTEEERAALSRFFDIEQIVAYYDPLISDQVKIRTNFYPLSEFISIWAKLGLKYPRSYLEAFLAQTESYYCFTPRYADHAGNWNSGITVFNWIGDNGTVSEYYNFTYLPHTQSVREALGGWAYLWERIPLLGLTVNPAFYTWAVLFGVLYALYRRKRSALLPGAGILLLVITCIAMPVNDCFRYYSPAAAAFPVFLLAVKARENPLPMPTGQAKIPQV